MIKKHFIVMLACTFALSSCSTVSDSINDNKSRYSMLTRLEDTHDENFKKNDNKIEGAKFLVANEPDIVKYLPGVNFDPNYNKLVTYLDDNGYVIVSADKLKGVATIVARVNKPMPDMTYISVSMSVSNKYEEIIYNVVYGGNVFKATKFYDNYVKTL